MRFWEDMQSKYGFGDGKAVPVEAFTCRNVYIWTVNKLAERNRSKVRCVAFNRDGCHNSCLILQVTLAQFKKLTPTQVIGDGDWDVNAVCGKEPEPTDEAFEKAVEEAQELNLDDYVEVKPTITTDFYDFLDSLKS